MPSHFNNIPQESPGRTRGEEGLLHKAAVAPPSEKRGKRGKRNKKHSSSSSPRTSSPDSPSQEFRIVPKENNGELYLCEEQRARILAEMAWDSLSDCGAVKGLSRYLRKRLGVLFPGGGGSLRTSMRDGASDASVSVGCSASSTSITQMPHGSDLQKVVVTNWIEELLRFLAIKAVSGDTRFPFEMGASVPIDEAWRGLMVMPSAYSRVCRVMGAQNGAVIDYDPFWQEDEEEGAENFVNMKRRIDCTLRTYQQCFGHPAPHLYWPEPQERRGGGGGRGGGDRAKYAIFFALDKTLMILHNACGPDQNSF